MADSEFRMPALLSPYLLGGPSVPDTGLERRVI